MSSLASRFRQGRALLNGGENRKLVNSERLPDLWRHPPLPVQELVQLRRDFAWMMILVRHPGRPTWRAVAPRLILVGIEKIKVVPRLTRIMRRRPLRRTAALFYCSSWKHFPFITLLITFS